MRIQNVIQDAELESLAELRILWDEHAAPPTPTPAPTPSPTPAPMSAEGGGNWAEVAQCDVEAVAFRIADIDPQSEEVWAVALDESADPSKYRTDIWGNPYTYQIVGHSIPLSKLADDGYVIVYGEGGRRMGSNNYFRGGEVILEYPWSCKRLQARAEDIEWSEADDLVFLAEFSGSRGDHNQFTTRFYLGRELVEEELRALVYSDQYDYWFGSGFIGAGTSSGNFNIADAGLLTWGYYYQGFEMDLGVTIPQNHEIVTVTKQRWGEREEEILQRFVWVEVPGDGYHMIEEKNPLVKGGDSLTDSIVLK